MTVFSRTLLIMCGDLHAPRLRITLRRGCPHVTLRRARRRLDVGGHARSQTLDGERFSKLRATSTRSRAHTSHRRISAAFARYRRVSRACATRADAEHFCVEVSIAPSEMKASHVSERV